MSEIATSGPLSKGSQPQKTTYRRSRMFNSNSISDTMCLKSSTRCWLPPLPGLTLRSDEVHVWRASLDLKEAWVECVSRTLSPDESERAKRYRFREDRDRYIAARGLLRVILSHYQQTAPDQLRFRYGPHGKPELDSSNLAEKIQFNLSHSGTLALYAVTLDRAVGIDLELIRPESVDEQIAERFFSSEECAALGAVHGNLRQKAFFTCWTRKEAYIKATGKGLSTLLDQFSVSLTPGKAPALLHTDFDHDEAARWSIKELLPELGYVGALCVQGDGWQLKCWDWPSGVNPLQAYP